MSETGAENAFLDLEFPVEVWLASEEVPLGVLLELEPGGILPLEKDPDGPVDLMVNGAWVASGELVVVDGKFGFRVTATTREKLEAIQAEKAARTAETEKEATITPEDALPHDPPEAGPSEAAPAEASADEASTDGDSGEGDEG